MACTDSEYKEVVEDLYGDDGSGGLVKALEKDLGGPIAVTIDTEARLVTLAGTLRTEQYSIDTLLSFRVRIYSSPSNDVQRHNRLSC